jgi:hypothetical protein
VPGRTTLGHLGQRMRELFAASLTKAISGPAVWDLRPMGIRSECCTR